MIQAAAPFVQQLSEGHLHSRASAGLFPEEGSPGHQGLRLFYLLASNCCIAVRGVGYLQMPGNLSTHR